MTRHLRIVRKSVWLGQAQSPDVWSDRGDTIFIIVDAGTLDWGNAVTHIEVAATEAIVRLRRSLDIEQDDLSRLDGQKNVHKEL